MMAKLHASTDHNSNLNHRQQDNDFRSMIENSLDLIIKVNLSGHYTYVNPAFCALYGTNAEDLLGRHYSDDVHEDDRAMVDEFFSKLLAPPHTVSFIHRENTVLGVRRLEWTGKGIMNAQGELVEFVGIARDVTDRLDLIDKLAEQAYHDELTGLANRRFLTQQAHLELERAQRYQRPLSLFILDIDHFKIVNDHYGHPSGDIVLKQLSLLMKDALREHDLIVRIGGEEFAVLLPEADLAGAIVIAERLREAVAHHAFEILHGLRISLTISIGVASTSDIAHDFEKLMQEPDVRLYRAKSLGRNQVVPAQT
ncbi:MAG: hypothetical protein B7Y16_08930 [Methylotenera sp. 24-45-7]|jgi:diguanylate cyclase (GGDEF)-like protein/PAS domain S-box-containing protein|nr:MAG: hypothetical protein B7Y72_04880 [Mehylophilales bacterium 35-46-6]OYZ39521.1 MAG: hypothetical protein B7Y16_08930 [Methylotenera sp. 24-45-7]